jgi:hypothetical protein
MKRLFCPRPLNKNTFTATASLSSSSNAHSKPRCRPHRQAGPERCRPQKSVTVARFIPRADRFFNPNSSFDGRLRSTATLHPTVGTSDGLRAGGVMRLYFEGFGIPSGRTRAGTRARHPSPPYNLHPICVDLSGLVVRC